MPIRASRLPLPGSPDMLERHLRPGSLINDLDKGIALSNSLARKLEPASAPSIAPNLSATNANDDIWVPIEGQVLQFPATFKSEKVEAEQLIADMIEAAEDEILLMSHWLRQEVYKDERIVKALSDAARRGVLIWVMIREEKDWGLLSEHPLGDIISIYFDNGIYVRCFKRNECEDVKTDFLVVDRKYFRLEPDYLHFHATAAKIEKAALALKDYFCQLWIEHTNNLSGDIADELHFILVNEDSPYFRCALFPGITVDKFDDDTKTISALEKVTSIAMSTHYSRNFIRYAALINGDTASVKKISEGEVRFSPILK